MAYGTRSVVLISSNRPSAISHRLFYLDEKRADLPTGFPAGSRTASYLRWLPAPMNNSMGIDNIKLTREARSAVRPHWAISAGAGVP